MKLMVTVVSPILAIASSKSAGFPIGNRGANLTDSGKPGEIKHIRSPSHRHPEWSAKPVATQAIGIANTIAAQTRFMETGTPPASQPCYAPVSLTAILD